MPCIVYSKDNITSRNIANSLMKIIDFKEHGSINGLKVFGHKDIDMIELSSGILTCDFIDNVVKTDFLIFVCSHKSAKGVPSLTTHSEGNWTKETKLGGKPRELSFASPIEMLNVLLILKKNDWTGFPITYEATHHGPLLRTPSFFVEVGGNEEVLKSEKHSEIVANAVIESLLEKRGKGSNTVVVGFGGLHYPDKFTRLAFEKGYAFSHIMPKYYIDELDMISQAIERSSTIPEKAIIEWKSIKSEQRSKVIEVLNRIGLDYEKV
jgi:D-aminoacyl-tRNA deacylase